MRSEPVFPSWWRLAAGFALGPAIPALAFSMLNPMYAGLPDLGVRIWKTFPLVLVVAYLPALILGVPAYFLLRGKLALTMLNCAVAGAVIAALPWVLMTLLPAADEASIGGRMTVTHGHVTWFGLLEGAKVAGEVGVFGAVGGAAFWLFASATRHRKRASV